VLIKHTIDQQPTKFGEHPRIQKESSTKKSVKFYDQKSLKSVMSGLGNKQVNKRQLYLAVIKTPKAQDKL
jgi:hypothetical protein